MHFLFYIFQMQLLNSESIGLFCLLACSDSEDVLDIPEVILRGSSYQHSVCSLHEVLCCHKQITSSTAVCFRRNVASLLPL